MASPVTDPVTKFGGQPVWVSHPQWPLSRKLGQQMRFICQISLRDAPFGGTGERTAYLFMTGGGDGEWVDGTYLEGGGENAVVVQPDGDAPPNVETIPEGEGPSLYRLETARGGGYSPVPCEFAVELTPAEDPEHFPESERHTWSDERFLLYHERLEGNKLGGTPGFIQGDEFPGAGDEAPERAWRLLLQLDSTRVPFYVDFGDSGVGYAYLAEDGATGRFLWQCC